MRSISGWVVVALFLLTAATPSLAVKVYVDYDKNYDKPIRSFAWRESPETSLAKTNGLLHSRIVNGIEHHLVESGLREDTQDPDVYVTYHTSTKQEVSLDTSTYGYRYPMGWYSPYWGPSWTTTTATTYTRGTLIVDVWDADTKQVIWRGTATAVVGDSPGKREKQVNTALAKMVKKWEKIRKRDRKQAG